MSTVTAVPIRPIARGSVLKLWIALIVLALIAGGIAWIGTRGQQVTTTRSGLRYQVVHEGTGAPIGTDDLVRLTYVGRLPDGTVFDSTDRQGGQPMVTGVTGLIPGFSEGLRLMKEGGTYRLWIPPHLGYGGQVPPGAPFGPNDTLSFDIHVVQIARGMAGLQQMMSRQQAGPGEGPGGEAGPPPEHANPHAGAGPGGAEESAPPGNSL
jgi:hypothetical protein